MSSPASSFSELSTTPSTPPPVEIPPSYLVVLGQVAALKSVGARLEKGDKLFFFTGAGSKDDVRDVLVQATDALDADDLAGLKWTEDRDGEDGTVYYHSDNKTGNVDLNTVMIDSPSLPPSSILPTFASANLACFITLTPSSSTSALTLHILYHPPFLFPPLSMTAPSPLNPTAHPFGVPSLADWQTLWATWDTVTLGMIPRTMLHQRPIDLRHVCLFYMGHIPTFLDMLLSKELGEENTEPKWFVDIFERGIDPHVDDPEHCHRHSEVPTRAEDWPALEDVNAFRLRVRARLVELYADLEHGAREHALTRRLARTLVMAYEHEGFHVETLLYMLIQRAGTGTLPPPGVPTPPFTVLAKQWSALPPRSTPTLVLGPAEVTLGTDDPEPADLDPAHAHDAFGRGYVWDNESPSRTVRVRAFRADVRPVTNAAYEAWWRSPAACGRRAPASWVVRGGGAGEVMVRTAFGVVGMEVAGAWPVMAAFDDLEAYAQAKGGRVPCEAELRLVLDAVGEQGEEGGNVGFRRWHPIPATADVREGKVVRGTNGGVWEWTATAFDTHEGFEPTGIFSGYSSDFFDGKHQVVLGASYATIPRQAGRRTLRNFYQHNYPYAWVGARVVYDVDA
ncbi:C-type lectin protein [Amylostereum chailletii]|nr:C-type lectin protein [Amylostereum chailletii]